MIRLKPIFAGASAAIVLASLCIIGLPSASAAPPSCPQGSTSVGTQTNQSGVAIPICQVAFTTTPQTAWLPPAGVSLVDVVIVGGGGAGSASDDSGLNYLAGGYGGGGGEVVIQTGVQVSGTVTVNVGVGGDKLGTDDTLRSGGASSFGSLTAAGGRGGATTPPDPLIASTAPNESVLITVDTRGGSPGTSTTPGGTGLSWCPSACTFVRNAGGGGAGAGGTTVPDDPRTGQPVANPSVSASVAGWPTASGGYPTAGSGGNGVQPTAGLFANNTTFYGGGGSGGNAGVGANPVVGGKGGGGNDDVQDALANSGGGGAGDGIPSNGSTFQGPGGAGGSGVVLVRFLAPASSIATLANLTASNAQPTSATPSLSPAFSSSTYAYSVTVPEGTTSLDLTPTLSDNTATWSLSNPTFGSAQIANGVLTFTSNSPDPFAAQPASTIGIKVTAQDGTFLTYLITVNVSSAPNPTPPTPQPSPGVMPVKQSLSGVVGTAVVPTSSFKLVNFTLAVRYSIYPALPAGLSLDPMTGVVSGTPTAVYPPTQHWITATGGGGSESAYSTLQVSVAAAPTPPPAPDPVPVPPLEPGGSYLTVDGVPQKVEVKPNPQSTGVDITGDDFSMNLQGLDGQGQPLKLAPDGVLILNADRQLQTSGTGFMATSEVDLYLDPPTVVTRSARSDMGTYVGTVTTTSAGTFSGTATLPPGIAPGDHVVQAVGLSKTGAVRAMSLGVRVEPSASLTLDQGTRKADGRHDRIRTTGSSTGIPAGTKLTPYIRYSGQSSFSQGKASIVVQTDGTFRWTREIRKDKDVTGYVAWTDVESNRVTWVKIR